MSTTTEQPDERREFRRYRQALTIGYLTVASVVCAILVASVVRALFFPPAHASTEQTLTPSVCEQKISREIDQLGMRLVAHASSAPTTTHSSEEDPEARLNAILANTARLRTQCKDVDADTPAGKALASALAAIGELEASRDLIHQFESDVAAPLQRARHSLAQVRSHIGEASSTRGSNTTRPGQR